MMLDIKAMSFYFREKNKYVDLWTTISVIVRLIALVKKKKTLNARESENLFNFCGMLEQVISFG